VELHSVGDAQIISVGHAEIISVGDAEIIRVGDAEIIDGGRAEIFRVGDDEIVGRPASVVRRWPALSPTTCAPYRTLRSPGCSGADPTS